MNARRKKKLGTLARRRDYLNTLGEDANSWDRQELAALDFAIDTIRAHYGAQA